MNKEELFTLGAAVAGVGYVLTRKPAQAKGGVSATVAITIRDSAGNIVPRNSPFQLLAGEAYMASFTVTNKSTLDGIGVPVSLRMILGVLAGAQDYLVSEDFVYDFGADQIKTFTGYDFTVPEYLAGGTGLIEVSVAESDSDTPFRVATEPISFLAAPKIVYAATVEIAIN